jgi:hypothetical protein
LPLGLSRYSWVRRSIKLIVGWLTVAFYVAFAPAEILLCSDSQPPVIMQAKETEGNISRQRERNREAYQNSVFKRITLEKASIYFSLILSLKPEQIYYGAVF